MIPGPDHDHDDQSGPAEELLSRADDLVGKLDALVDPAPEPENAVLVDGAPVVKWTGPLFALFSLIMVPWTIYIGASLPARQLSPNYAIAWGGFDALLLIALGGTAYFALRRSRYLSTAATATATLLVVDAWFDVLTTPGPQVAESIALAVTVELPLAGVCIWLSHHTQELAERRISLLLGARRTRSNRRYRAALATGDQAAAEAAAGRAAQK